MMTTVRWLIIFSSLFVFLGWSAARETSPARERRVTKEEARQWRADLQFMAREMPKWHKNLYHTVTREHFTQAVRDLDRRIPDLSRHEIIVGMVRIAAMIGDGHTNISPVRDPAIGFHTYPFSMYFFKDGLYIRGADSAHSGIVGFRVTGIGHSTVDEAYDAVRRLIGADNEMGVRFFAPFLLSMPEVLDALGIVDNMDSASYTIVKGAERRTVTFRSYGPMILLAPDTDDSWVIPHGWVDARLLMNTTDPLWLRDPRNKFWFEYLQDTRSIYVQFNKVDNKKEESVADFTQRLFSFVQSHPIDRFILDLRLNRGGDGQYNRSLLLGIIRSVNLDQKGKLYTIIGRGTWSAAQFLVNQLDRYTNTLFVGEPTGGKINSFGDSHKIMLPYSGITVRVSTLWWQEDERDTRPWIAPDISAELTFDEYKTNTDPALDAIIRYAPERRLTEILMDTLSAGHPEGATAKYAEWRSASAHTFANVEQELNTLGYALLSTHRVQDALVIFRINVAEYPHSANVYDSIAEALLAAGRKDEAIRNYQISLSLNPKNSNAIEMLGQIRGGKH